MLDVKTNLEALAHILYSRAYFGQNLMFGGIKETIPGDELRIFNQQPPELDEVTIAGALVREGVLDKGIELRVASAGAFEIDPGRFGGALVMFTEAGDAGRGDALRVAGTQGIEQWTVSLVEEKDAIDLVGLAEIGRQTGPEGAHIRMIETEPASFASFEIHFRNLLHPRHI